MQAIYSQGFWNYSRAILWSLEEQIPKSDIQMHWLARIFDYNSKRVRFSFVLRIHPFAVLISFFEIV